MGERAVVDVDTLPPTQYLILEVLAARYRLGEQYWTFPDRLGSAARKLEEAGLVWLRSGPAPNAFEARFTDTGRVAALSGDYSPPICQRPHSDNLERDNATLRAEVQRLTAMAQHLAVAAQASADAAQQSLLPSFPPTALGAEQ